MPALTTVPAVQDGPSPTDGAPFDPHRAWALSPQVALRPERFGALAYHFGTRRLSFLKSPRLLTVVEALGDHPSALQACVAVGITAREQAGMDAALATLARTDMIVPRVPRSPA
jgi:putative mycofactocin binding protein MftB